MATAIEVKRHEAQQALAAVTEERAKYDEDNLPSLEDVARLEALVNAEADIREGLAKIEGALAVNPTTTTPKNRPSILRVDGAEAKVDRRSLGERFVEEPGFKAWLAEVAPNGRLPQGGAEGTKVPGSPRFQVGGLGGFDRQAALVTGLSDTSGGAFITADRMSEFSPLGRRPLRVRDVITVLQTSSDLVEFVRQLARTNAAAIVAEATATSGGTGAKPESDATFEVANAIVRTIANWMAITRQAASDVPQLRGIIDTELRDNLEETLETEIVTGTTFPGIFETTGTQTQAWDTNILTTTRKAKTLVSTVGRAQATAYIIKPAQWEAIDLLQDNEARYYYGGPLATGIPRLWGLPVVESEAPPTGFALVGDFRKCVLWDREQANILVSDSHSDFFIRNLIAILAEGRWAFGVKQPSAIVEIDVVA